MLISLANGAVVVTMERRAPNEAHALGTVLSVGGGVPWLRTGHQVYWLADGATEVWVRENAYNGIEGLKDYVSPDGPVLGQTASGTRCVYLIDQRRVHAVVSGAN